MMPAGPSASSDKQERRSIMRHVKLLAAAAFCIGASWVAPSASELQLVFTSLEVPGAVFTNAQGINARGDVVGFYTDAAGLNHGFRWSRGAYSVIDVPNARVTQARGIGP